VKALDAARAKPARRVVGLMSGTSADGVDAALVSIRAAGAAAEVETLAALTVPYAPAVRAAVLALGERPATELCRWNVDLGDLFADAALRVIAAAGLRPEDVDLVGSHGQTVVHLPRSPDRGAATLQIGEPSVIAERTGLPVVADFRMRDVAAGGEGAPLVPWVDWLTLRPRAGARLVQNLGGVGNVTLVTQDPDGVVAFDTGPANGPLDAAAALVSSGTRSRDEGGALAAAGAADENEVRALLAHPYFDRPPPKSLSRETFGEPFVAALARRRPDLRAADLLATLTEFVARSVADAYVRHLPSGTRPVDVVVSGGGVHNPALLARLRRHLEPLPVRSSAELGIDPDAREAVAFAVLANETLFGNAGNLPRVTGARWPVVLGKIVP
jgi:anhydro-N-acetylmuramic acid kinase